MLVIAEYLVGIAAAYAIIRYVVIPAMRKSDSSVSGGTGGGKLPGDATNNPQP